jgi:hypothetical protein
MTDANITTITTGVYNLLNSVLTGLSNNAEALVGLLILGIIVYLAKDLIKGVFGIFGGIAHMGKK